MDSDDTLHAGDPCPICGGKFVPDPEQDPERLIDAKHRNSPNPDAAARYERRASEKADREGVIHKCIQCGYRARFKTAEAEKESTAAETRARQGRDKARDERDAKAREEEEARRGALREGEGDQAGDQAGAGTAAAGATRNGRASTRR